VVIPDVHPQLDVTLQTFWSRLRDLLKGKVCTNGPCTIDDVKENVHLGIAASLVAMLHHVFASLEHHVQLYVEAGGKHF
jgi:hypothetical protein